MQLARYAGLLAASAVPLALLWSDPYWVNILAYTYLFAALAAAWNIIGGFGGQFSLGHGVFFAIGAYRSRRLYLDLGLTPWLAIFPAAALAAVVALLISWPTFRLRGPFFAIATMAFNEACFVLANYSDRMTGGPRGILVPFRAGFSNMIFIDRWKYALLMFAFMVVVVLITVWLRRARLGYYLLAVRDDEDAARAAGIDVLKVKLQGMALSAFLTGVGGGLFAMYVRVIDPPTLFTLPEIGVKFALIALIGGIGTIFGPVFGALLIVPLENWLRGTLGGDIPGGHLIILGAILVSRRCSSSAASSGAVLAAHARSQAEPRHDRPLPRSRAGDPALRRTCRGRRGFVRAGPRRDPQHHRAERRRQDHAVQPDHRPARAEQRRDRFPRRAHQRVPPQGRAQRGMGRTFQIAKPLIGLTTLENVMVGAFMRHRAHADAYDHASAVLAEVGLEARAEVPAAELTLSERRRLEVARALALEPKLILLDEVMAGLNATEVGAGDRADPRLNTRGMTFLVIEHNLKVVRAFSRRVIVLHHGAKIAEGTADDVLGDPQVVTAYLGKKHAAGHA